MSAEGNLAAWEGKSVAITGGAGFIGSTLAHALARAGAQVTIFDNFNANGGANPHNLQGLDAEVIEGDVRDEASIAALVAGQEVLFNLAAQTSHKDSMDDPYTDLEVNARAQLGIVEAVRKLAPGARIVFGSTRQIYGAPIKLPVEESHPLNPPDVNAINKIAGEHYHLLYGRVHGLKVNIARFTNTYGPRMRIRDSRQMFLGAWIGAALSGQSFEVWGGHQKRDLCHVDDAVSALIALAETPTTGQAFNIGGSQPVTLIELAERVTALTGGQFLLKEFPADRLKIDIGDYQADFSALTHATGWRPQVELDTGLRTTIDYFKRTLAQYR